MQHARSPQNESQRLADLHSLNILDTPIDERFERITRMVCRLLDVPIATFSLVDENREWCKSVQGLPATEMPRDISFCAHAVAEDGPMVVTDARFDPRFSDNPLVTGDPHIGFYASYPVRSPNGAQIGTICAIDHSPRFMNPEQMQLLKDMAALAETELQGASLSNVQKRIMEELDTASYIDPLTRIWNRAGATEILEREWAENERRRTSIGIMLADVDHLKRINDAYGRASGDAVLQEIAKRMLGALRPDDTIARYGDEEFLFIFPNRAAHHLPALATRLHQRLVKSPITCGKFKVPVTVSFGGVAVPSHRDHSIEKALSISNAALGRAKETRLAKEAEASENTKPV